MLNVEDMSRLEMQALLSGSGYGHLGCAHEGRPYVVPMHFAYDGEFIYFATTEGTKTKYLADNPEVCLQVETVQDVNNWRSVMVIGKVARLTSAEETETAMGHLTKSNPTLTPALNFTRMDGQGRPNFMALYRLRPAIMDGRKTIPAE